MTPAARREEFDAACREYGAECASSLKLALMDAGGEDYQGSIRAKSKAFNRVREAWQAMVAAGDPETKQGG